MRLEYNRKQIAAHTAALDRGASAAIRRIVVVCVNNLCNWKREERINTNITSRVLDGVIFL